MPEWSTHHHGLPPLRLSKHRATWTDCWHLLSTLSGFATKDSATAQAPMSPHIPGSLWPRAMWEFFRCRKPWSVDLWQIPTDHSQHRGLHDSDEVVVSLGLCVCPSEVSVGKLESRPLIYENYPAEKERPVFLVVRWLVVHCDQSDQWWQSGACRGCAHHSTH